jgi:hypothetical protein
MTPKAGIVEPEEKSITRQRLRKQVSASTDTQATVDELLGTTVSVLFVQRVIKKRSVENQQSSTGVTSEEIVEI